MTRKYFAGVALAFTLAGCAVSQQQEVAMGQSYAQQVNAELPIVTDAELVRYISCEIGRASCRERVFITV